MKLVTLFTPDRKGIVLNADYIISIRTLSLGAEIGACEETSIVEYGVEPSKIEVKGNAYDIAENIAKYGWKI